MSTIINAGQLRERLGRPGLVLLDVRLPEDFAAAHIPGAVNQCVFEVTFLPELEARQFPKDQAICVYGATADSHESRVAAEKLERVGYTEVVEFRGGLQAWIAERNPVKDQAAPPGSPLVADGRHELDLAESRVVWIGRNLINKHWGHVGLASGHVEFRDGLPIRGEAVLDLRRITCTDLAGDALHEVLIHHLESDDFFDVERFPEAAFRFDRTERCGDSPGCCNLKLHGELTLRGVTKPLVIGAAAGVTPEGKAALQATFTIDRTDWGVLYGSGRFFQRLAGHLVNDAVELQLRILTV
jgi:polyisoprenoid-binding protein YceI/rhodanese-related sulfurtransferase